MPASPPSPAEVIEPSAPRMIPRLTDDNRDFWTSGSSGSLRVPRCTGCRQWVLPPAGSCPACGSTTRAEPVSGRARVMTWTTNHQAFHPDVPPPNLIAVVVLEEAETLRLATNLVRCEETDLSDGTPVRVLFERHGDVFYPLFEPDGEAGTGR